MKREFSGQIFEKYSNFMKICSVGAEMFYVGGRTDRQWKYSQADRHDEAVALRNFANAPTTVTLF